MKQNREIDSFISKKCFLYIYLSLFDWVLFIFLDFFFFKEIWKSTWPSSKNVSYLHIPTSFNRLPGPILQGLLHFSFIFF